MKFILFIGLVTLLCGEAANALKCYRYDDDGDDICIVDEDCTDKSEIITCSGGNDTCGWAIDVS